MTTTSTSATLTPAQQLHTAAQRLRCHHAFPIQPPHGSLGRPGPCKHCGVPYTASSPVADRLREPLAAWLEQTAKGYQEDVYEDEIGCNPGARGDYCDPGCPGHQPVAICDRRGNLLAAGAELERCKCWRHAITAARVVNGSAA